MPSYPGLGQHIRYRPDRQQVDYFPVGLDQNGPGAESELLLVREVAMMIIMDRLTDKPNWHIKMFDETISKKWSEEALEIPVDQLWDDIVNGKSRYSQLKRDVRDFPPEPPPYILDAACMEYVRNSPRTQ